MSRGTLAHDRSQPTREARPDAVVEDGRGAGAALRGELRGLDYAGGAARLAPVQREDARGGGERADGPAARPRSFAHWLQGALNTALGGAGLLDAPLRVDGILGPRTAKAICAFQANAAALAPGERPLAVDGRVGPVTLGALERAIGEVNPFGRESAPPPEAKTSEAPPASSGGEVPAPVAAAAERDDAAVPSDAPVDATDGSQRSAEAGATIAHELPLAAEEVAAAADEVERAAPPPGAGGAKAGATDLDAMMAARLESARAELGKVSEREFFSPPPHLRADLHPLFEATLAKNRAAAKPGKRASGVWFARDAESLARLVAFARGVQLDYEKTAVTTGYQWCGSFIAAHYHLDASFAFVSDKKKKGGGKAPVARANGNTYLASTDKSYDYFNYAGEWAGAYLRDPAAPSDAAAAAAYVPLRAYHAAHGGERGWLPVETWKSNPLAVVRPGMVLFVKATPRYKHGAHMIFVDRVESDGAGGWVVHTVEGNAPGAKTAPGRYTIGARGDTVIVATARPALSDFDAHLEMVDADVYRQKLKEEAA